MIGMIAGLLGSAASAGAQTGATLYTNHMNRSQVDYWNNKAIELANTAHQREVADLKAAGLNPILSASGAGASVPSLGTATLENPGQGIADGINSATKMLSPQYQAQVSNLKANTEHINLVNSALAADRKAMDIERRNEQDIADLKRDAVKELSGVYTSYGKNGTIDIEYRPKERAKNVQLIKEGYISDWKMKSNQNWRSNLESIGRGASSASSLIRDWKGPKIQPKFFTK